MQQPDADDHCGARGIAVALAGTARVWRACGIHSRSSADLGSTAGSRVEPARILAEHTRRAAAPPLFLRRGTGEEGSKGKGDARADVKSSVAERVFLTLRHRRPGAIYSGPSPFSARGLAEHLAPRCRCPSPYARQRTWGPTAPRPPWRRSSRANCCAGRSPLRVVHFWRADPGHFSRASKSNEVPPGAPPAGARRDHARRKTAPSGLAAHPARVPAQRRARLADRSRGDRAWRAARWARPRASTASPAGRLRA